MECISTANGAPSIIETNLSAVTANSKLAAECVVNSRAADNSAAADTVSTKITVTMSLRELVKIAVENPQVLAMAQVHFNQDVVVVEFPTASNIDFAGKLTIAVTPLANGENLPEKLLAILDESNVGKIAATDDESTDENLTTAAPNAPYEDLAPVESEKLSLHKLSGEKPLADKLPIQKLPVDASVRLDESENNLAAAKNFVAESIAELLSANQSIIADESVNPEERRSASKLPTTTNNFETTPTTTVKNFPIREIITAARLQVADQIFPLMQKLSLVEFVAAAPVINYSDSVTAEIIPPVFHLAADSESPQLQLNLTESSELKLPLPKDVAAVIKAAITSSPDFINTSDSDSAVLIDNAAQKLRLQFSDKIAVSGEMQVRSPVNRSRITLPLLDQKIMQSGLMPSEITREAAQALDFEQVPIDRSALQLLLAVTGGRSGENRADILSAAARLLKLNAPISVAVAAGSAQLHSPIPQISVKLNNAIGHIESLFTQSPLIAELEEPPEIIAKTAEKTPLTTSPETPGKIIHAALTELKSIALPVDSADLTARLRLFFTTFARESLARSLALIENAAEQILNRQPDLVKINQALSLLLDRLNLTSEQNKTAPDILPQSPAKLFPITAAKLPDGFTKPLIAKKDPSTAEKLPTTDIMRRDFVNDIIVARSLKFSRYAHPGIEEFPAEWRDFAHSPQAKIDLPRIEQALRVIFNDHAPTPTELEKMINQLDRASFRELAATLQSLEHEEIANNPVLNKLAAAAGELRDLGRIFTALKMENLATEQQNPSLMNATVPFSFSGQSGDEGKLKMFYHRGSSKKSWSQRVVLDLDLSMLGGVLGDMRWTLDKKLTLTIGAHNPASLQTLTAAQTDLILGLAKAGFICTPEFRLLTATQTAPTQSERSATVQYSPLGIDIHA